MEKGWYENETGGTERGGWQGLMSEWNIMYDRHCDIPHGKIGMFMSEILKQQAGHITPLIANTYSVDAGRQWSREY